MKRKFHNEALASILKSHLNTDQDLTLKVTTNSMSPLIERGDSIVVQSVGFDRLNRGDIVLYSQDGSFFCHRLVDNRIKEKSPFLITKGDSEFYFGKPLDFKHVLGRVSKIKKQRHIIDCDAHIWRILNLFLGMISFLEAKFLEGLRIHNRKIFGKHRFFLTPAIKHIICMPFYLFKVVFKFFLTTKKEHNLKRIEEDNFVSLCSKIELEVKELEHLKDTLSTNDLDWNYILARAKREGLCGLFYNNLKGLGNFLPKNVMEQLRSNYIDYGAKNLVLFNKLKELSLAFREEGIKFIVLKGLSLLSIIYPNIALRPIGDIDILIKKEDYATVKKILDRLGYVSPSAYPEDFIKDDILIDVHWSFINYTRIPSRKMLARIDVDEVFTDAIERDYNGNKFLTLGLEDLLIHLSLHWLYHHELRKSIFLVDILGLLEQGSTKINWNKFQAKLERYAVEKPIFYVLSYLASFKAKIPQDLLKKLQKIRRGWLESRFFALALSRKKISHLRFFLSFLFLKGLYYKLKFLRETFLPRAEILRAIYPQVSNRPKIFLYFRHLVRVLGLSIKASLKACGFSKLGAIDFFCFYDNIKKR